MFKDESEFKKVIDGLNIDTEPDPKHRQELRRQVLSVFNKTAQQSQKRTTPLGVLRRKIMKSPVTKIAAAAVIIIAVLIGLNYFGDSVSITSTAYAEIVERLHNARTLTYTLQTTTPVEGVPTMRMEVAFREPGYMRMTMPGGYVSVMDYVQGKGISIIPPRKQFVEIEMSNLPNDPAQQQFESIEKMRSLPDRADEELGTREIDGRVLQGFRVTEENVINTVWIDLQTRELVIVEMEFVSAPSMSGIMTDFQFDVDLDDSLFSLTPPDDYTRMELQVDLSEISEQDLIEFLRLWSTWTKDGTFPPTINPAELSKLAMEMEEQGKFGDDQTPEQERLQHVMQMTRGLTFLLNLPAESNWRYAGEAVKFGDAGTPIFWYRPKGAETYRVIYGDLSVKDVAPENLPK
jgi:outer membrane lipoprotein-sorting protein